MDVPIDIFATPTAVETSKSLGTEVPLDDAKDGFVLELKQALDAGNDSGRVPEPAHRSVSEPLSVEELGTEVASALEEMDEDELVGLAQEILGLEENAKEDSSKTALAVFWARLAEGLAELKKENGGVEGSEIIDLMKKILASLTEVVEQVEALDVNLNGARFAEVDLKGVVPSEGRPVEEKLDVVVSKKPLEKSDAIEVVKPVAFEGKAFVEAPSEGALEISPKEVSLAELETEVELNEAKPDAEIKKEVSVDTELAQEDVPVDSKESRQGVVTHIAEKQEMLPQLEQKTLQVREVVLREVVEALTSLSEREEVPESIRTLRTEVLRLSRGLKGVIESGAVVKGELSENLIRVHRELKALVEKPVVAVSSKTVSELLRPLQQEIQTQARFDKPSEESLLPQEGAPSPKRQVMSAYGVAAGPALKIGLEGVLLGSSVLSGLDDNGLDLIKLDALGLGADASSQNEGVSKSAENLNASVRARYGEETVDRVMQSSKDSLKLWVRKNLVAMEIKIDPPELGRIHLKTVLHQGRLGVVVRTESAVARDILMSHVNELIDQLKNQGVDVVKFTVEVDLMDREAERDRSLFHKKASGKFDIEELLEADEQEVLSVVERGIINKVA